MAVSAAVGYRCARSSPQAARRALGVDRIRRLAAESGATELLLTGGEPFLLPDIDELAGTCTARLPTTLLTNGMLFRGARLERLRRMDRARLALPPDHAGEPAPFHAFLDTLGIDREDQVIRTLAHRGVADHGLELTVETLIPEVTVTADGVYWHPVSADHADQLVTRELFPLGAAIAEVRRRFVEQRARATAAAQWFPCA